MYLYGISNVGTTLVQTIIVPNSIFLKICGLKITRENHTKKIQSVISLDHGRLKDTFDNEIPINL